MPTPVPPARGHASRRQVLTAALAGSLTVAATTAGCSLRVGQPDAQPTPVGPTVDQSARARVADQANDLEQASLALAAASTTPATRDLLSAVAADHRAHAAALRGTTPGPQPTPATTPPATASVGNQPPRPLTSAVLRTQSDAERQGVSDVETLLADVTPEVARLLASVAASRAAHAEQLQALASTTRRAGSEHP